MVRQFWNHLAKPLPVARMRDGEEDVFVFFFQLGYQLRVDKSEPFPVAIRPHAHHLRAFHEQIAEIAIEVFFYSLD